MPSQIERRGNVTHARALCAKFGLTFLSGHFVALGPYVFATTFSSTQMNRDSRYWYWAYQRLLRGKYGSQIDFMLFEGTEKQRHRYFLLETGEIRQLKRPLAKGKGKHRWEQIVVNIDKLNERSEKGPSHYVKKLHLIADSEKTGGDLRKLFRLLSKRAT